MKIKTLARISDLAKALSNKASHAEFVMRRRLFVAKQCEKLIDATHLPPLTSEQEKAINEYWGDVKVDKRWIQYYNAVNSNLSGFDARYVPNDFYFIGVDSVLSQQDEFWTLMDKNLGDLLFNDVRRPETVARGVGKAFCDEAYHPLAVDDVLEKCAKAGRVICKPSYKTGGGHGIVFWKSEEGVEKLKDTLCAGTDLIVQRLAKQHPVLNSFHDGSINTIRLVTYFDGERHVCLTATLRMGTGRSMVDNFSSGGCFCGIDENGRLRKFGFTSDFKVCTSHPNGQVFEGVEIPGINEAKALSCELAYRFTRVSRLVSWDWTIDEDCRPMLIEANLGFGGLNVSQLANGPLFGDYTKDVIKEVLANEKMAKVFKANK